MSAMRPRSFEAKRERLRIALSKELRERGLPLDVASVEYRPDGSCVALLDLSLEYTGTKTSPEDVAKIWLDLFVDAVKGDA